MSLRLYLYPLNEVANFPLSSQFPSSALSLTYFCCVSKFQKDHQLEKNLLRNQLMLKRSLILFDGSKRLNTLYVHCT